MTRVYIEGFIDQEYDIDEDKLEYADEEDRVEALQIAAQRRLEQELRTGFKGALALGVVEVDE